MRRIVFIFFLFSGLVEVQAQVFENFSVGLSTNATDINWDCCEDIRDYGFGVGTGITGTIPISEHFSMKIGTELAIRRVQLDYEMDITGETDPTVLRTERIKTTSSIYLISIPFTIEADIYRGFYTSIGPRLDIKLGNKNGSDSFTYQGTTYPFEDEIFDYAETLSYGWSAGIGKSFKLLNTDLQAEARFNGDFSRLIRKEGFVSIKKNSIDLWVRIPFFYSK